LIFILFYLFFFQKKERIKLEKKKKKNENFSVAPLPACQEIFKWRVGHELGSCFDVRRSNIFSFFWSNGIHPS